MIPCTLFGFCVLGSASYIAMEVYGAFRPGHLLRDRELSGDRH
jgi:hypothetical protein